MSPVYFYHIIIIIMQFIVRLINYKDRTRTTVQ